MIQAVVFDFDGVLADSEPCHLAALAEVLGSIGIQLSPADYYARYLGLDDVGVFRTVSDEHDLQLEAADVQALIERKSEVFDEMVARADVLFPAARTCVERLAASYPLGIASGALRHEIEHVLDAAGLTSRFRFIVASGETPHSKPHPDPYRRAAELHEVAPEACLAIEDSRWGIESARAAGLRCIGITTSYPAEELPGADLIISSLDDFTPELIRGL